jgi:hypothetical protein
MAGHELTKSAVQPAAAEVIEPLDQEIRRPATAAEAAQVIDLSTFPLLPGVLEVRTRAVARLDYTTRLKTFDVRTEYEFQRRNLLERQWKELSSQISGGSADGQFSRAGFHLYVSVFLHDEPGKAVVRLQNNSNVNVGQLPVPPGANFLGVSYNIASYETTTGVKETRNAVDKLLHEQGWQPVGTRGDALDLKQNDVMLTAVVQALSRRPGRTRIAYSTAQMSANLPVPANAASIEYDVEGTRVKCIASGGPEEVVAFYKNALPPAQWKATTENRVVENGVNSVMIFRNPGNDMLRLTMWESRSRKQTRITLKHHSAAEVEGADR